MTRITLIHSRIEKLASEAIEAGHIISCDRTELGNYLILKPGEFVATESTPIATGVFLLVLLKKL